MEKIYLVVFEDGSFDSIYASSLKEAKKFLKEQDVKYKSIRLDESDD